MKKCTNPNEEFKSSKSSRVLYGFPTCTRSHDAIDEKRYKRNSEALACMRETRAR